MDNEQLKGRYDPETGEFYEWKEPVSQEANSEKYGGTDCEETAELIPEGTQEQSEETLMECEAEPDSEEVSPPKEELLKEDIPLNNMEESENEKDDLDENPLLEMDIEPDDPGIKDALLHIQEGMELLIEKFDKKILQANSQDTLTKTMYAELQEYKKGLYSSILKPLLLELVQIRDNILKQGTPLLKKEGEDAVLKVRTFLSYADDIADVLEMYNVEIFKSEPGTEFDPKRQKVLKKVMTSEEGLNKKIAASLNDGYRYEDRVLMKENVLVYVYVPDSDSES